MKKYFYIVPLLVILIFAGISYSCIQVVQPGGSSGGSSSPPLAISVWVENTTYPLGAEVRIHYQVNQAANLTMYGVMPNGATNNYFNNALKNAGEYIYTGIAGQPTGMRIIYLNAINAQGQSAQASCSYQVGSASMAPNPNQ